MQLLNLAKEAVIGFVRSIRVQHRDASIANWWVEIITAVPRCTYYFGPFDDLTEARSAHSGYVEDLIGEGAKDIKVRIKRCQPQLLTICESDHDLGADQ